MANVMLFAGYAPSLLRFRGALLRELVERGHDVIGMSPRADSHLIESLGRDGVRHAEVSLERQAINPWSDWATQRSVLRVLGEERPDVLLNYTMKPIVWGGIAARRAKVPRIYSLVTGLGRNFRATDPRGRIVGAVLRPLLRAALKGQAGVIFQNDDDEYVLRKAKVLPPGLPVLQVSGSGVDLDEYPAMPLPARPRVLLLSRILAEKGIREYAEAAAIVRREFPECEFELAGAMESTVSDISPLEVQSWQAEGSVRYLGPLADVRPRLAACSLYVLPSYAEGRPRSVLEALATGRPVITCDSPGCRQTIEDGVQGTLVPPGNAGALASAIAGLLRDPGRAEKMAKEARILAEQVYDVRKVNAEMIEFMGL
jgi:glycosyltransferase involved in cell wall biosynthesis